ncbi:hypothetical protein D3C76_713860 [compost metagenome]
MRQLNQGQGGERCFVGRLDHHAAAGGQGRTGLAGDHRGGEIPRRDRRADADALLDHQQALVRRRAGNHVAVDALAFLGEPLDEGGGVADFTQRFVQRLALLQGHQLGEVVFVFQQQFVPAAQDLRAFLGGPGAPAFQRGVGGLDGAHGFRAAHQRHAAEQFAAGRVGHRDAAAVIGIAPLAGDIGLLAEEVVVFQIHRKAPVFLLPGRRPRKAGGSLTQSSRWATAIRLWKWAMPCSLMPLRSLSTMIRPWPR